jgi:hypothetical protein
MNLIEDLREASELVVLRINESVVPIARCGSRLNAVDAHGGSLGCEVDQGFGRLRGDTVTHDEKRSWSRCV